MTAQVGRRWLVSLGLAGTLAVGGCRADEGSATAEMDQVDPCGLFSAEELKPYLNVAPEKEATLVTFRNAFPPIAIPGMRFCHLNPPGTLSIGVATGFPQEAFSKWVRAQEPTSLNGLGTEAAWSATSTAVQLVVLDDDVVLGVNISAGNDDTRFERARHIAGTALDRIRERGATGEAAGDGS